MWKIFIIVCISFGCISQSQEQTEALLQKIQCQINDLQCTLNLLKGALLKTTDVSNQKSEDVVSDMNDEDIIDLLPNKVTSKTTNDIDSSENSLISYDSQETTPLRKGKEKNVTHHKTDSKVFFQEGLQKFLQGQYTNALSSLEKALSQSHDAQEKANCIYYLGEIAYIGGNYSKANDHFRTLCDGYKKSDKFVNAKMKIAQIAVKLNNKKEAIRIVKELQDDPKTNTIAVKAFAKKLGPQ